MKTILLMTSAILLAGCMDSVSLKPKTVDTSFYLVDTKFRYYCRGESKQCTDMTKIVSARHKLVPIEEQYGAKITGPNYPVSLMRMIMSPQDGGYQGTPYGSEGRYVKLPINEKTDLVWNILQEIENGYYGGGT